MVSLIFGVGAGAWIYNQSQRRNGGQSSQSLMVAGIAGLIAFIVFFTLTMNIL